MFEYILSIGDIQFGNCQSFEIEFEKLLPAQKQAFMQTFKHGLQRLDKKFIPALIWQDNAFNVGKVRMKQAEVDRAADEWTAYLSQLAKTYDKDTRVCVDGYAGAYLICYWNKLFY